MNFKKEIIDRIRLVKGKVEFLNLCYTIKKNRTPGGGEFYIITGTHLKERGLFGDINVIARYINYALAKGLIPVVDFKHVANGMMEDNLIGKVNGWETLFNQPTEFTLNNALNGKKIIIADCHGNGSIVPKEKQAVPWEIDFNNEESINYWINVYSNITLKKEVENILEKRNCSEPPWVRDKICAKQRT